MLNLNFKAEGIEAISESLGATEKQVKFALSRAAQRTAATLRKQASKGFKSELDVKKMAFIRKRLRAIKIQGASVAGAKLWFGLNPLPLSMLRGSAHGSRSGGASWGGKAGRVNYPHGFILSGKNGRGKSIYSRDGKARTPIREASVAIDSKMNSFIKDDIFDDVEQLFMRNFIKDLNARINYNIGGR